jgi:predicted O-linked N-acetylglucosamine transferase (SPINDLY family)
MISVPETFALALQYHQAGNVHQAEDLYRQILQHDPYHADSWHLLGEIAIRARQNDRAIDYINYAIRLNGGFAPFHNNLGVAYEGNNQLDEAAASYFRAIELQPDYAEAHNNLGVLFMKQGKLAEAVASYQEALKFKGDFALAHNNLGNAFQAQGKLDESITCYRQALLIQPSYSEAYSNLGNALSTQGKMEDAESCYRQALWLEPANADALNNLGSLLLSTGKLSEAIEYFQQAVRTDPEHARARHDLGEAHNRLGLAFVQHKDWDRAAACFRSAIQADPTHAQAYQNLGSALCDLGQFPEAIGLFQEALRLQRDSAQVYCNLGIALTNLRNFAEAENYYRQALRIKPDFAVAQNGWGVALSLSGKPAQAQVHYQRAIEFDPQYTDAYCNLGNAFQDQGKIDEAREAFLQAVRLQPDHRSNYLMCLNYLPEADPDFIVAEHSRWGMPARTPPALVQSLTRQRRPDQALRIGYVSPDFRSHVVAGFLEPILRHHDPRRVEVFGYAEVLYADAATLRLQALCRGWHRTCGRNDDQVAEQVRADGIDILVDLAGHMAGNRLGVFARKPAPVQVTYLGYPNITGVKTIDYRLSDAVADPPGEPASESEMLFRLPGCFCCFQPPEQAPEINPLPALRNGRITFGSLHKLAKLNGSVFDVWSAILQAVPSARLLVCHHTLEDETKERLARELRARTAAFDRVELRRIAAPSGDSPIHLPVYGEIDISLDPFPWGGHGTACDSLWMGVPVITRYGAAHPGRMVASVLTSVGLSDWIAVTPAKYLELAVRWAGDLSRLAELRLRLRDRMKGSPLCDGQGFARKLEEAYRLMWRRKCSVE